MYTPGTWVSYSTGNLVQSEDGIWYLHLKVSDNAGNETLNKYGPYKVDKTLPVITNVFGIEYTYGSNIKLQFEAMDSLSGLKETYVNFYSNTYNNGADVTLDKPGTYNIEIVAIDIAGNIQTVNKQIEVIV